MSTVPIMDDLDAVMQVMDAAFDPAFGEAWTRKQVADALCMPNTWLLLADRTGAPPASPEQTVGFALSRGAVGEEELLLIAVMPAMRGRGVGMRLLERLAQDAADREVMRIFLEMRDGNPALKLYRTFGFREVGRRKGYYRKSKLGPIDAITFAKELPGAIS